MPSAAVGLVWAPVVAWVITSAPATVAGCAGAEPASALSLVGAASCARAGRHVLLWVPAARRPYTFQ